MQAAPCRVWRGPCLDWLQHTWADETSPPWGGEVSTFRGTRIAAITGYAAASVPWSVVQSLAEGNAHVTRMDLCVDVEGYNLPHETYEKLRERGERELAGVDGRTRYKGSKDSELQWRAYLYYEPEKHRPWLWMQEAELAGVDVRKSWRIEVQTRGRIARQLAAMPSAAHAWTAITSRWPDWPRVHVDAVGSGRVVSHKAAEVTAAKVLADRCRAYIKSQARRCARKVGLTPDETRDLLLRVAVEALADLTGFHGDGIAAEDMLGPVLNGSAAAPGPDTLVGEPGTQGDTDDEQQQG